MPSYENKDGIVSTFADIISAPDPTPAPKVAEQRLSVKGRKDGEKAVQRFDRQRERRRQELQDEGESLERIDEILAEEFSEERRQEVGRQAQRDTEIAGTDRSRADPTAPRRRVNRKTGKVTVDVPDIGLEGQPDGLVDPIGRAADEATQRGVFRTEAQDIERQRQIDVREGRTRTIRPARDIQRDPLTRTPGGPVALTMEAARVLGPVDVPNIAQPNIFSRILLEDMPLPQPSVTAGSKTAEKADGSVEQSVLVKCSAYSLEL